MESREVAENNLQENLYRNVDSNAIEKKKGVAKKNSLRTMEVTIPMLLFGEIELDESVENAEDLLEKTFKWVRHLGVGRNRGLGRCRFVKIENN